MRRRTVATVALGTVVALAIVAYVLVDRGLPPSLSPAQSALEPIADAGELHALEDVPAAPPGAPSAAPLPAAPTTRPAAPPAGGPALPVDASSDGVFTAQLALVDADLRRGISDRDELAYASWTRPAALVAGPTGGGRAAAALTGAVLAAGGLAYALWGNHGSSTFPFGTPGFNPPLFQPTNPPPLPAYPPGNRPINPPTLPINPPDNPPTNPPGNPPANPPTNPPSNPPTNPPSNPPTNPPSHPPTNPPSNPPANPPSNPPAYPPTTPSVNPPAGPPPPVPPTTVPPPTGQPGPPPSDVTPEPVTALLFGSGLVGVLAARRRRKR